MIHMRSPEIWKPSVFITGFFLSLLYLKADDTYLQLKKDLEYLDLKVSGHQESYFCRTLTFLSVSAPLEPSPRQCRSYQIWIPDEGVCSLHQKSFVSCSLRLGAQFLMNSAIKSLDYGTRAQGSDLFLALAKTKRSCQVITGCFFRASSGVGVSLVHEVLLIGVFSHQ